MTSIRIIRWICVGAVGILAVAAGIHLASRPARNPPLRIGINAWPGYEHLYLAKTQGFFQAQGVDVEIVEFHSLLDARRALERGQIHGLGTTATDVALTLGQSSSPIRIVQMLDYSNGGDLLVADSAIQGIEGLRGRKVGLERGSVGSFVLARALATRSLSIMDIQTISSDPLTMTEDFQAGRIDALVTYPPFSLQALGKGKGRILFSTRSIPDEVVDVIAMDGRVLDSRPEDVRKMLRAYWQARKAADDDPARTIPIMASREGISDSEFTLALRRDIKLLERGDQARFFRAGGLLPALLARTDSVLRTEGLVRGPARPIPQMRDPLAEDGSRGNP